MVVFQNSAGCDSSCRPTVERSASFRAVPGRVLLFERSAREVGSVLGSALSGAFLLHWNLLFLGGRLLIEDSDPALQYLSKSLQHFLICPQPMPLEGLHVFDRGQEEGRHSLDVFVEGSLSMFKSLF